MEETLFESVIRRASFGFAYHEIILDIGGNPVDYLFLDVNRVFEELSGIRSSELLNRKASEVFPDDKKSVERITLYGRIAENCSSETFEYYSEVLKRWYSVMVQSLKKGFFITLFDDITNLKKLQEELVNSDNLLQENQRLAQMSKALAESELSYRSIFDHATDAIYIHDKEGVFLDVNPSAIRMYGYEKEEMVGYTPEILSAPGRNDLEKTKELLQKAFKGETQRFEWWGIRKNGEVFPKEIILNNGLYFGKKVVIAMARDITDRIRVIGALKESEDKYRTLTDQLPVGVYRTSVDGRLVYSNPALVNMLNYDSADELLQLLNASQLYANPSDRSAQLEESKSASGVIQSEFQLKKKSGDLIWVKDNSRLVFDRYGSPAYFDGILEDITENKRAENALKESEANLKAIIENTLENIWSIDRNYRIQYVNEVFAAAFRNSFGVQLKKGISIVDSLPENLRQLWKERYDRAFNNEHFVFEDKVDIGNSSVFIEVAMNPIVIDGKVVGASFYGKDVTDKRLAEIQLEYLSDLQKLLIDLSSDYINLPINEIETAISLSLKKIGEFVGADRAYVFDYDFQNKTATNTFEWCSDGTEAQIDNFQAISLQDYSDWIVLHKSGGIVKIDDTSKLPDNNLRKLLESQNIISALTIPLVREGECTGFVGFDMVKHKHTYTGYEQQLLQVYAQTLVNVKERLEKEQKLISAKEKAEESDRLKSAFLANMSHEIRTPMNGILGFLDLLKEPDLSEENKTAYIRIVTESGHRLLDTINDIIEISKIEAGELKVNMTPVNISELMGYYHGFFRQQTDQKGLVYTISNRLPEKIHSFKTDRIKLESIITNLIKNAIKFTFTGFVEFGCSLEGDNIVFYIKDTGTGIPADRRNVIFERFVQADISSSRPHEGSGLGLSIVKAYIKLLNGKIWVQSEVGEGSTFTFSIPFYFVNEEKTEHIIITHSHDSHEYKATVLIAEDDYSSYLYLEKLLSVKGIAILHTTNGADTVKVVSENPNISLILMDIKMSGMTGLDATRQIRQINKTIPIIAQTAYALAGDRESAIDAGCNDYISKPLNSSKLLRLIEDYIVNGSSHERNPFK
jgi:PAS domain S-box-containing protein